MAQSVPRMTRAQAAAAVRESNGTIFQSEKEYNSQKTDNTQKNRTHKINETGKEYRQIPLKGHHIATPERNLKRPRAFVKNEESDYGTIQKWNKSPNSTGGVHLSEKSPTKKARRLRERSKSGILKLESGDTDTSESNKVSNTASKKVKSHEPLLTPGKTPYPNWPHPTPQECEEVVRLLSSAHGEVKPPEKIPLPSLTVSGCGEVPSVLDALIRTRLSAATSDKNSSRAFAGLVAQFGILEEGIGKGSVNWNAVRKADTKVIYEAIKSGGLADVKSKDIKKILQMVWEENQARRAALKSFSGPLGTSNETADEKNAEIARAEEDVLSLDHLHLLSSDEAFNELLKYPGVGPKTASCVLLFCLQRPSFAVDTHVFRLCKWLGWVPGPGDPAGRPSGTKGVFAGPTRNSTYAHCEVRIPDELKYPLHKLLIKHGRTCPRCRAITGEKSEGWNEGCVIDHLVKRSGGRKDG